MCIPIRALHPEHTVERHAELAGTRNMGTTRTVSRVGPFVIGVGSAIVAWRSQG